MTRGATLDEYNEQADLIDSHTKLKYENERLLIEIEGLKETNSRYRNLADENVRALGELRCKIDTVCMDSGIHTSCTYEDMVEALGEMILSSRGTSAAKDTKEV